jgi:hypothetical protein
MGELSVCATKPTSRHLLLTPAFKRAVRYLETAFPLSNKSFGFLKVSQSTFMLAPHYRAVETPII